MTLTATAVGGNRFDHWQGGIQGVDNPDSLVMGENDVTVTAVFTPDSHTRQIPAGTDREGTYIMYSAPLQSNDTSPEGFFGISADDYDPGKTPHRAAGTPRRASTRNSPGWATSCPAILSGC